MKHTYTVPITQDNLHYLMQDLVRGDEIVLMSIKLLGKNVKEALRNFGSLSTKAKVYTAAGLRVDKTLIKRESLSPLSQLLVSLWLIWITYFLLLSLDLII